MLTVFAVAELVASVAGSRLPEPLRWYDATAEYKIEQMADRGPTDVVFIGTSMAWQNLVPAEFVAVADDYSSAYNAGLAGGVPSVMQRWTLEEVVPLLRPDTVVWGVSSLDLAPNYGDENLVRYDEALETRSGLLARLERATSRYSNLIRYRAMFRDVNEFPDFHELTESRIAARRHVGIDGERLDFSANTSEELAAVQRARLNEFVPATDDLRSLAQTIASLTAMGIEVVIVEMPVPQRFIAAHPNGEASHVLVGEALNRLAVQLDVRYLDASDQFDDDAFVDFTHLNAQAAAQLSRWTGERLNDGGDDRRDPSMTQPGAPMSSAPAPVGTDSCTTQIVLDEYGIEVQVEVCDAVDPMPTMVTQDGTSAPTATPIVPLAPDGRASVPYNSARLADAFIFASCEALPPRFIARTGQAITDEQLALVNEALDLVADTTTLCGTPEHAPARSVAIEQLERAAGITRLPMNSRSEVETASRTLAAVAALRSLDGNRSLLSGMVRHVDELAARLELQQRSAAQDPIEVVVIGSSLALRGISQPLLDSGLTSSALNTAMAGADTEEWLRIYPRLFEGIAAPEHVIIADSTHRLLDPASFECARLTTERRDVVVQFRASMFPSIDAPDWDLILGPDAAASPLLTTGVTTLLERFVAPGNVQGTRDNYRGIPDTEDRYPGAQFCAERLQVIAALVDEIRSSGAMVSFVFLPVHPDVFAAAPEAHQQAQEEVAAQLARLGVPVTFASAFTDTETYDGFHANPQGRDRITRQILPEIAAIVDAG